MPTYEEHPLTQEAIKSALNKEWYKAIGLNEQILKDNSQDVSALNRLGRAYGEIGDLKNAKKNFKEALKMDPVNLAAEHNLRELGKYKTQPKGERLDENLDKANFVMEPATTAKIKINFLNSYSVNSFEIGAVFNVKKEKDNLVFEMDGKHTAQGVPQQVEKFLPLIARDWEGTATLLDGKGKSATVLLKSPTPIFRDKKQEIRPFLKHEQLDEVKLDLPNEEE